MSSNNQTLAGIHTTQLNELNLILMILSADDEKMEIDKSILEGLCRYLCVSHWLCAFIKYFQ